MIDTVCLLIKKNEVQVNHKKLVTINNLHFNRFHQKPNNHSNLYYPTIKLFSKFFYEQENFKIEFSVPKLLLGNNLEELDDYEFEKVISTLSERLSEQGLSVPSDVLKNARVIVLHYSKNIWLGKNYSVCEILSQIKKVNISKRFDAMDTKYINGGESIHIHNTSNEFVIYDKVSDIRKTKSRSRDKANKYNKSLLKVIKSNEQILRLEVRLNKKTKIMQVLGLSKNDPVTFREIYSTLISKKVVTSYWENIVRKNDLGMFQLTCNDDEILKRLSGPELKLKPKDLFYLYGLLKASNNKGFMQEMRNLVTKNGTIRTWYRIKKDIERANKAISYSKQKGWVNEVEVQLANYRPIKLDQPP